MNIKNLLLIAACASMSLVACNKEVSSTGNTAPKSVTISLGNVVSSTKSVQDQVQATAVQLNNFQVFFSDGTTLYQGSDVDGNATPHYFDLSVEGTSKTNTFHYVDGRANKVIVVGNLGEITAATEVELNKVLAHAGQQDVTTLSLYGDSPLTQNGSDVHGTNFYTASVKLTPRVSRFEITGFEYVLTAEQEAAGENRTYATIKIADVALNNYYTTMTLAKAAGVAAGENKTLTAANIVSWLETEAQVKETLNYTLDAAANYLWEAGENKALAQNFFAGALVPQLVFKILAGTENLPIFIQTTGFTGVTDFSQAGKVYRMKVTLDDSILNDPENLPVKCVEVTVDVIPWAVVETTPEF